jgi:hypothetical protein
MTSKRCHLFAALGLAALSAICFGLLGWALVEGAVVANFRSDARVHTGNSAQYERWNRNAVYAREEAPGVYWGIVGMLGFFGTLFAAVAALERGSYRLPTAPRKGGAPSPDLLAKIDRACGLYPEGRVALLRAKAALVDLSSPAVETALDSLLEKVIRAPDQEAALKEIKGLARALDLFGKL